MVKTVICSVGISAARKIPEVRPRDLSNWVKQQPSVKDAAEKIFLTFRDIRPEGESLKSELSAEIHSLVRIGITDGDRVILLASSTEDGYCCAIAVEKYLHHYWTNLEVQIKQVQGLQVLDAELFRTRGVIEFVGHILKEIDKYGASNIILNPTGGYKALVPYTVLVGMLKGVKCDYIFEQSTKFLELPPLPVEFIRSSFETHKGLFEKVENDIITQAEWERNIYYDDERERLKSFFEFSDGQVILSAIGSLFLSEIRKPSVRVPFLSQKAIKDCFENIRQLDDCDPFRFLSRVAASEETFKKKIHLDAGNGLLWLKPGRTTDRYLVSVEGWRLLVWRAIREDQEGAKYASKITVNPETERRSYSPFMRMDFVD
ncbi:putative CRISPR-associated protein [Coleofasciculus sp. F4-SAH-05]|uniref:putative CRISPR-associated protein n=1 Tax=Coleofasciculus sp. F4-SAH-05 TaxID=3069525 RepID=UPI00330275DD